MNIGDRIKQRRSELNLTVDELAEKTGKSRATIYRYENGDIENMPTPVLEPLAKALETTPADLMGWIDVANENKPTKEELYLFKKNSYENLVVIEMKKMNQKGRAKLLDTAREMVCNPLYNPEYETELNAAHVRKDINIPRNIDTSENDIMDDENF